MSEHIWDRIGYQLAVTYHAREKWWEGVVGITVIPSMPVWQLLAVGLVLSWLVFARAVALNPLIRKTVQPLALRGVEQGVNTILLVQRWHSPYFDHLMEGLAWIVSVEFYTAFLPLFYWSQNSKLGRSLTAFMALCLYVGNSIKDCVSAPRPPAPPVRRLANTNAGKEDAQEFGLPSSHTINTLCMFGYLLHYLHENTDIDRVWLSWLACALGLLLVFVVFGRIYLGMHSPIDIFVGGIVGTALLAFWCCVDEYVDFWITRGENAMWFQTCVAMLALVAYPTPQSRTPSFEQHTAFNGVVLGTVWGIQRTYDRFHGDAMAPLDLFTWVGVLALAKRVLIGLPILMAAKSTSKAVAKFVLPLACQALGIPIRSSSYLQGLAEPHAAVCLRKKTDGDTVLHGNKFSPRKPARLLVGEEALDVDTGIRLLQYAGLAWSVMELAPRTFLALGL